MVELSLDEQQMLHLPGAVINDKSLMHVIHRQLRASDSLDSLAMFVFDNLQCRAVVCSQALLVQT
jgi:hypothetical protein